MKQLVTILFLLIVMAGSCGSKEIALPETADSLINKSEYQIDQAAKNPDPVAAANLCDAPLSLLDRVISQYPKAKAAHMQAQKLRAICFDMQAKYPEELQALQKYADLASDGNRLKAAEIMKARAEKYIPEEPTKAIMIYRLIEKEYPESIRSSQDYLKIPLILEQDQDKRSAVLEYDRLWRKNVKAEWSELSYIGGSTFAETNNWKQEAIDRLRLFLEKCPASKYAEFALWKQGVIYADLGQRQKAKEIDGFILATVPKRPLRCERK